MARKSGTGDQHRIAGLYQYEYDKARELASKPDPRALFMTDDLAEQFRISELSPTWQGAQRRPAEFDAGEPIEVRRPSRRQFPDSVQIPWLADLWSGVRAVLVFPDDTVYPVYE
jgi:hypothetical protein